MMECVFRKESAIFAIFSLCMGIAGQTAKTSRTCVTTAVSSLHLKCKSDARIHVGSITYEKTSTDCQPLPSSERCTLTQKKRRAFFSTVCKGISRQLCHDLVQEGRDTFTTTCNGRSSCWESINDYWMVEKCGYSTFIVTVNYECIEDNIIDVCEGTSLTSPVANYLFLASPNFANPVSKGPNKTCHCEIEGQDMTAEILELYLLSRGGKRSNISITSDRVLWFSQEKKPVAFNDVVLNDTTKLKLTVDTMQLYGQILWLRITGSIRKVLCNGGANGTMGRKNTFQRSNPENSSPDTDLRFGPLVVTVILLLLVLTILFLLIYILYSTRPKYPSNYSIHSLEDSGISYIKFDYISNSSLPDESASKTWHESTSLADIDGIVYSGSMESSKHQTRTGNGYQQSGSTQRNDAGSGSGDADGWEERDVDTEATHRRSTSVSPRYLMLQRD